MVSVPVDVTGEGPTISLGLMRFRFVEGTLWIDDGWRELWLEWSEAFDDLDRCVSLGKLNGICIEAYMLAKGD